MPRLRPVILHYASKEHTLLPLLLRECRDITSARNELRWLRQHVSESVQREGQSTHVTTGYPWSSTAIQALSRHRLKKVVLQRSRGYPLQYILGNQPFGDLEILCRKKVLIPRPETELYTIGIAKILLRNTSNVTVFGQPDVRVLDLCTGTGCISLLLHSILVRNEVSKSPGPPNVIIKGVDVSENALALARDNLDHNVQLQTLHHSALEAVHFCMADVLELGKLCQTVNSTTLVLNPGSLPEVFDGVTWDVVVSNPPYISTKDYGAGGSTTRSVRNHEPMLALVPQDQLELPEIEPGRTICLSDVFYFYLVHIACAVGAKCLVMEVGGTAQARRVGLMTQHLLKQRSDKSFSIEVWADDGSLHDVGITGNGPHNYVDWADTNTVQERAIVVWLNDWTRGTAEDRAETT